MELNQQLAWSVSQVLRLRGEVSRAECEEQVSYSWANHPLRAGEVRSDEAGEGGPRIGRTRHSERAEGKVESAAKG